MIVPFSRIAKTNIPVASCWVVVMASTEYKLWPQPNITVMWSCQPFNAMV